MEAQNIPKITFTELVSTSTRNLKGVYRPRVLIALPVFNEEAILRKNFQIIHEFMETLNDQYNWRILIINDGSKDNTRDTADEIKIKYSNVCVYHFFKNFGLGQAHRFAIDNANADDDYIVFLDIDLSYSVDHVKKLLDEITTSKAKLVLASPYMKNGKITNITALRKILSQVANKFLSFVSQGRLSTLTCMVRAYDIKFFKSISFRNGGMDFMPEAIYKTMVLRGMITQIPAHLNWAPCIENKESRKSSMIVPRQIKAAFVSGFIFRPFMFFIVPGLFMMMCALYSAYWMFYHYFQAYVQVKGISQNLIYESLALSYSNSPHTFIVCFISFVLSFQFLSLGILSLQNKKYFEELFTLGNTINKKVL